jgi:hypothetical protein
VLSFIRYVVSGSRSYKEIVQRSWQDVYKLLLQFADPYRRFLLLDIRLRFILNQIEPCKMIVAMDNLLSDLIEAYEDLLC